MTKSIAKIKALFTDRAVGKRNNTNIVIRKGFFYTMGRTSNEWKEYVCTKLKTNNIKFNVIDFGSKRTSFRGGASLAHSSH